MITAFTLTSQEQPRDIRSKIKLQTPIGISPFSEMMIMGLWDTGATTCCITKKVAETLKLIPIDKIKIKHAGGESIVNRYLVNIVLPNNLIINNVLVSECALNDEDYSMLVGMDVINLGDWVITNANNGSKVSYQYPSTHDIDFVEELKNIDSKRFNKAGLNDKCPCGSGKKYKDCCWKKFH